MPSIRLRAVLPALLALCCSHKNTPPVSTTALGWIHSNGKALVDDTGRQWLFRGINARVSGLFDVTFDGGLAPLETIPDLTEDDVTQMAAAGFNLLRLPFNWSGVEPTEGQFNQADLDQLTRVIGWCNTAGIYVLVDFHQDDFSKYTGEDGAPLWAVDPPPDPVTGGPLSDRPADTSSAVSQPFQNFFMNTDMLQDRFLPAFTTTVAQHLTDPTVVGYEPMNEPGAWYLGAPADEPALQAFYEKVDTAFRTIDTKHTLWLEPDADRNVTLVAPIRSTPFPDSNIVYEPHMYPEAPVVEVPDNSESGWVKALAPTFDLIVQEAAAYGAAPVLGEWGEDPSDPTGLPYAQAIQQLLETHNLGEAFWLWKEESQGDWGFFDLAADGGWTLRASGLQAIALPYPLAVPGTLDSYTFDPSTSALSVQFTAKGGEAAPLLYLSPTWYPSGVIVTLNGDAVHVGTGRVLLPWGGDAGTFTVTAIPAG